ncbi:hypothetical protein ACFY2W_20640 [Streptomyces sp. NPDC001262]|uniref:hypothetical protein n=1 Tax=Streptomyces TaxID=1883 RepID=UPI0036CF9FCD
MDAGLAAVSGALAAAVATVGAAFAAGWAQREGMQLTIRAEDRKDLRRPRFEVYLSLFTHATNLHRMAALGESDRSTILEAMQAEVDNIEKLWPTVALRGPEDVATHAEEINNRAQSLYTFYRMAIEGTAGKPAHEARTLNALLNVLKESTDSFKAAAQKALYGDETPDRRRRHHPFIARPRM